MMSFPPDALSLVFPWPPSINNARIPVKTSRGKTRLITSDDAKIYQQWVRIALMSQRPPLFDGFIGVHLTMHPKIHHFDIDNFRKILLDCCKGTLWKDDSMIWEDGAIHAQRVEGGMIIMRVWSIDIDWIEMIKSGKDAPDPRAYPWLPINSGG